MKFYNFVCSIEEKYGAGTRPLSDNEADREIISFYVRYHYLLSQNDTTASNALIGSWQKKLGHQTLWEDFNLGYVSGPPPANGTQYSRSRSTRAPTRKSTGGISAPKPVKKANPLTRRRSEEYHCFSDSPLTPLPSSDDEDDTPPQIFTNLLQKPSSLSSRSVVSRPNTDLPAGDRNYCSAGSVDQGTSQNYTLQDVDMDSGGEPPPTPPASSLIP